MIYRMLKNRNYYNISKNNQIMYVWNPFGNKYKVYYLFEKIQNEWKVIENASLNNSNSNEINNYNESSSLINKLKNKSSNNEQKIVHGLGFKTIPLGGYMCTKSKQKNNNQCIEDDEVLPLYGESDYSDYITDSEVENELFEMEQKEAIKQKKKIKANHDKKNNININSKSKSIFDDKSIDEIDISDSYEDILFDDNQENIDSYEDILYDDNQENNIKNGIILNKPLKSKNKSNILFSFSPINIPNKREGLSITEIDKIIKDCIERYKMEWEEKKLYKLNEKIFFYYSKKNEYQGVENEYNDITYKRIPSLIETIKLHEYKSDKSLIRCCGILQESVYTQCRLKWLLELYKKPEEEFKNLKQLNNEKKVIEKAENKNEKNGGKKKTYIYEKEDWSDFIDDSEEFFDDSYQSNNDVVNEDSEFNNEANLLYNKDGNDIDNDSTLKLKNNLLRTNNIINKPINNNINYNKKKCLFQNNEINNDNEKNNNINVFIVEVNKLIELYQQKLNLIYSSSVSSLSKNNKKEKRNKKINIKENSNNTFTKNDITIENTGNNNNNHSSNCVDMVYGNYGGFWPPQPVLKFIENCELDDKELLEPINYKSY